MRPLEILLLVLTLGCLLVPYRKQIAFGRIAAFMLAAVLIAHILIETARWQMFPIYLVGVVWIALALIGLELPKLLARVTGAGALGLIALATALSILLPILAPPPTTGQYAVGTATYHLVQHDRPEIHSADTGDVRQLMLQVWYPAQESDAPKAAYMPDLRVGGPAISRIFGLPPFTLNHVNLIEPNAQEAAPLALDAAPFPLLLFSHGRSGTRIQNTQMVEELVSHGYVVAAVDHAYGAGYTVYPDGRTIPYDQGIFGDDSPEQAGLVVNEWVMDFQFVIEQLAAFNADENHLLGNGINLNQLGAFGHSTGGGAAIEFCYRDERCGAALGLDPWLVPTSTEAVEAGLQRPIMVMKQDRPLSELSDARLDTLLDRTQAEGYYIEVEDSRHYDFTDFKRLSPALNWIGLTGGVDGDQMRNIMNEYGRTFFDFHLRGWQGAILFADSAEYPEVTLTKR